jgi:hypothetical protein
VNQIVPVLLSCCLVTALAACSSSSTTLKRDVAGDRDVAVRDDRETPVNAFKEINPVVSVPSLNGLQQRLCVAPDAITECWQNSMAGLVYVTSGKLRIRRSCLEHGSSDEIRWGGFPSTPSEFVRAADEVVASFNGPGCMSSLNPARAQAVAEFVRTEKPVVECEPQSRMMVHTERGSAVIALSDPRTYDSHNVPFDPVQGFRSVLFQELLHAKGDLENLPEERQNDRKCRKHDAIYALAWMCFPGSNFTREITQAACEAAVAPDRVKAACSVEHPHSDAVRILDHADPDTARCIDAAGSAQGESGDVSE